MLRGQHLKEQVDNAALTKNFRRSAALDSALLLAVRSGQPARQPMLCRADRPPAGASGQPRDAQVVYSRPPSSPPNPAEATADIRPLSSISRARRLANARRARSASRSASMRRTIRETSRQSAPSA